MASEQDDRVSRSRYEREKAARKEAEALLEGKSRELFLANQRLSEHSEILERTVTERTSELRIALDKAEAASAMRARFIATMSHEIRTPLGGLLGMIDLMYGDETDPAKRELLEYAKTSGEALKRIVNDVLDFSKMEAGAFQFENEKVDIRALIGGVLALAAASMPGGESRLRSSISPTVPPIFAGDATRIRQVLANLVSNAGRYSTEGQIELRAFASPHEKGALLRVEIEDQGIGISAEQQKDLFKDFTQVPNKLTSAAQGTGLGLAISRRIIEGADGKIGVFSEPGVGSTFWFELPVEVLETTQPSKNNGKTKLREVKAQVEGARILLAEDNKINQKLLLTFLKRMNVNAELAENGRVAVEKFAPGKYDLVLMDVAMPEMDGLEATRIIRDSWPAEKIPPIVVLTAHVLDAIHEDSARVGIDRVLSKPITFGDLRDAISEELGAHDTPDHHTPRQFGSRPAIFVHLSNPILEGLIESMSENEVIALVEEFVIDARRLLAAITANLRRGEAEAAAAEAHALKGMSGLIGALGVSELAGQLEQSAAYLDADSIEEVIDALSGQIDKLDRALSSSTE
ncbi:ATP-binding protein [Aliiruegeria sabulilitoris]|uniref:ATP-binding protein n=1 Tax=Aliiruegeria sabulilitoris TaxID=1510458 RepID=UPI0014789170|nr:ATP-binding protein [Aliiruegeria sabulilitoris]